MDENKANKVSEKMKEYYCKNRETILEKAKIIYQNLSEQQKELKRQYSSVDKM